MGMLEIERGRALRWDTSTGPERDALLKSTLWLPTAYGMGSTKDMKIRVLVRVKERAFVWQERTIVKDEKKLSSMWTVREVLVDRPFDIDQAAFAQARAGVPFGFEHCEFCILAPPSRRLSQHLLQAMHHERRDQLLRRWMPFILIAFVFAVTACCIWGCGSSRCFVSPLVYSWSGLGSAFDCAMTDRPCQLQGRLPPWMLGLPFPDGVMKGGLLFMRLIFFILPLFMYGVFFSFLWVWAGSWLQPLLPLIFSRPYVRGEEANKRRNHDQHHSFNAPSDSIGSVRSAVMASSTDGAMKTSLLSPDSQLWSPAASLWSPAPSQRSADHSVPSRGASVPFSPGVRALQNSVLGSPHANTSFSPASWRASTSPHLVHRPGRGGGLGCPPSTPGARGAESIFGGLASPQEGVPKNSPHTHGFGGGGNVRFNEEVTFYNFSPSDAAALQPNSPPDRRSMQFDLSLQQADLASATKPGMTPILPEERSASFSKWCSARRTRLNESDDLRRKNMRGFGVSGVGSMALSSISGLQDSRLHAPNRSAVSRSPGDSPGVGGGSPAMGLSRSRSLTSSHTERWWLEVTDGAIGYCDQILAQARSRILFADARMRALVLQTSHGLAPAEALLEQTERGVRRWVGIQVMRHVLALVDQVDQDLAKGLHKPKSAPVASSAAGPAPTGGGIFGGGAPAFGTGGGGFGAGGGGFGAGSFGQPAPVNAQQQQQKQQQEQAAAEKAKKEEEELLLRANALDRQNQLNSYTTLARYQSTAQQQYAKRRIIELAADPDVLGYVWDGGSSQEYVSVDTSGSGSRAAVDSKLALSSLSHVRLSASTPDSTGARGRRVWPGLWECKMRGWDSARSLPSDAELLMHVVATFLDVRLRGPVRSVPGAGAAKPAAASGAFGAPAAPGGFGGGAFGGPKPALGGFGAPQPAVAAPQPAVDPAREAANKVAEGKFFSSEHLIHLPLVEDKQPQGRRQGSVSGMRTEISDLKQRPMVLERFVSEKEPHFHFTLVLDRAKHTVPNTFGQTDGHKILNVEPRPGPDNLFQMLAILAIELKVLSSSSLHAKHVADCSVSARANRKFLKSILTTQVHYKGKLGSLDLAHPALNLMSFVPLEVE